MYFLMFILEADNNVPLIGSVVVIFSPLTPFVSDMTPESTVHMVLRLRGGPPAVGNAAMG